MSLWGEKVAPVVQQAAHMLQVHKHMLALGTDDASTNRDCMQGAYLMLQSIRRQSHHTGA